MKLPFKELMRFSRNLTKDEKIPVLAPETPKELRGIRQPVFIKKRWSWDKKESA